MFTINTYAYESCAKKCRNADHGERINSVLVRDTISDEKIAAFIAKTCRNFAGVCDHQGQSALHVAAASHKYAIAEWLINSGADINLRDRELGQTPLHKAVQFGHFDVAVLLLSYGASLEQNDNRHKVPAQYCCKPKNYVDAHSLVKERNHFKEILVWGNNLNYNLGLENKGGKPYPYNLDYFSKQNLSVQSVSLSRYHCLYVDDKGDIHSVGLGDGGRLGTNNETTLVLPKRVHLSNKHKNEVVTCISAAKNHSVALTSEDRIFTCGLNPYGQLGLPSYSDKSLIFRDVEISDKYFKGVIARENFSLAYTSDAVYVWGLNVGQFGLPDEKLTQPKKLPTFSHSISVVEASEAAIACLTNSGSILLFSKYKVKTLKKPIIHENVRHIAIRGGEMSSVLLPEKVPSEPLELFVIMESDSVYLWSGDAQKYLRCEINHPAPLREIIGCGKYLLAVSNDGGLFHGELVKRAISRAHAPDASEEFVEQKSNRRLDIDENNRCEIHLTRIPCIDRVTDVSVDQKGESFVVLQESSKRYLTIPPLPDEPISFKALLTEANEFDQLHDVVFHVDDEVFPAHKFIVFSRAEGLRDIVKQYPDKHIYLNFEGLTSKMFELIMKYIYENHTLTVADMEDVESSFDPYSGLSNLEIYALFREYLGKFGVAKCFDRMMNAPKFRDASMRFNRLSYPELYDVTIRCDLNADIKAHRCILSNRLDYFNMMFNSSWSESRMDVIHLTTVPKEYLEPIINFLYDNDAYFIRKQNYTEAFLYHLMEICDQFFVNRLKNVIELIMIEKMTSKKCGDMFEFSQTFNCELLESVALEYICQNMSRLLENHCLEHLQVENLERISKRYAEMFQFQTNDLIITLYAGNITDESVMEFVENFRVDLSEKAPLEATKAASKLKKMSPSASDRRNYEKEAASLIKSLSVDADPRPSKPKEDRIVDEAKQVSEAIREEVQKWVKVSDKKDLKKKSVLAALSTNAIIGSEEKERGNFTPLKSAVRQAWEETSDLELTNESNASHSSIELATDKSSLQFHLSLGDFTPLKSGKVSQKQRKRQLSQSENTAVDGKVPDVWSKPSPITPIDPPNAWNIPPSINESEMITSTPMKSRPISINTGPARKSHRAKTESISLTSPSTSAQSISAKSATGKAENSFSKILEEERKQKEYFNKMKSKSLLLTQLEETAIAELKRFYNVDDVFDEYIEVERRRAVQPTVNFAEWKYH